MPRCLQGGTEPDLLNEVAWWQTDDFWPYALFAAVAYIRATASRAGVPVPKTCRDWLSALATQRHNDHSGRRQASIEAKIRVITRVAFGFHNPAALIGLAMLALGGLRPALPGR